MNDFKEVQGRVGVMGDNHGNLTWLHHVIEQMYERGITHVLHLGDFGLQAGPVGEQYMNKIQKLLHDKDMFLIVTLGNHENYDVVNLFKDSTIDESFQQQQKYERILFARRGQRWTWEEKVFLSLGGANSINRYYLRPGVDWWENEQITDEDVAKSLAGGFAHVMLTHDAPLQVPILEELHKVSEPLPWTEKDEAYGIHSRIALRKVTDVVQPKLLLHGHYHFRKELFTELSTTIDETTVNYILRSMCFEKEGYNSNFGILNLSDLSVY